MKRHSSGGVPSRRSDPVRTLDENTQRRLVLQAARECAPDQLPGLRSEQPTLADLDRKIRESFWVGLLFVWTVLGPIAAGCEIHALWRVRRAVEENWRQWLEEPDAECELWILEGDIRRLVGRLPWSRWRQRREITRELKRVSSHWAEFQKSLEVVRKELRALPSEELEAQQRKTAESLERETDATTAASLERQLRMIEGQLQARQSLLAWGKRLKAARQECAESLRHLRSRLALLAAAGDAPRLPAVDEATADLQALNARLAATQDAAEEILRLC